MEPDHVDGILAQWARERPDLDASPIGLIGRLHRLGDVLNVELRSVFAEAGLERENVYITNVVKHFKFERRGKVRLHKKLNSAEIHACQPWLDREIALVKPRVLVCLGSTAAQALLGAEFRVTRMRGKWIESRLAPKVMATVHPSSILRGPREERERETLRLIADLKLAARGLD